MPELRGTLATPEVKAEWERAYELYQQAPGAPYDKKADRTERISYVAEKMNLTRKQAKRKFVTTKHGSATSKKGWSADDRARNRRPLKGGHMLRSSAAQMTNWELVVCAAELFYPPAPRAGETAARRKEVLTIQTHRNILPAFTPDVVRARILCRHPSQQPVHGLTSGALAVRIAKIISEEKR